MKKKISKSYVIYIYVYHCARGMRNIYYYRKVKCHKSVIRLYYRYFMKTEHLTAKSLLKRIIFLGKLKKKMKLFKHF